MNTQNKIKYRTTSIVLGILTLVSFALAIGSFVLFGTLGESRKEETIYTISAFGFLLFAFLFVILGILFVIFSILKMKNQKKISASNPLPIPEVQNTNTLDEGTPLYTYSDDRCVKPWPYIKGVYYSSPVSFYVFLLCMVLSYFLLFVPIKTSMNSALDWACVVLIITMFTYLFFFIYLILPLITIHNAKKNKIKSMNYVYEDKIVVVNTAGTSSASTQTQVTTNMVVVFDKVSKARKDKSAYYFNFLNDKGRAVCLVVSYEGVVGFPTQFYDQKMKEINNRKQ